MSNREGIEIDYCPTCRGVWLDRGELDKIIERSAKELASQHVGDTEARERNYEDRYKDDRYRNDPYYYKRKRKGLLGELFDFD
jgi:Zn-finger nucleic acid-binding protein